MRSKRYSILSSNRWGRLLLVILLFALVLGEGSALQAQPEPPHAYPALLQMAQARPHEMVKIIVQRKAQEEILEQALQQTGGKITKELPIVNGFAMELPAHAVEALARSPGVRWISIDAPMYAANAASPTVRDEFSTIVFNGNNGSKQWGNDWQELGEFNGPTSGRVEVGYSSYCASSYCLKIGSTFSISGYGASRQVNLSGAQTATLSFSYRRYDGGWLSPTVKLQIRHSSGNWTTLATYTIDRSDWGQIYQQFDISAYIANDTEIRFIGSGSADDHYIYIDNVDINYDHKPNAFLGTIGVDQLANLPTPLDGSGINVAVIDSGISPHNDLRASNGVYRIVHSLNLSDEADANDYSGHGSHVAGIIAGNGNTTNGVRPGVASKVGLINVKVSNAQGMSLVSDIVAGLQWIYDNKDLYNIQVVNISLNSTVPEPYHVSPLSAAVEILWFNGIVVVVSAGNNGDGNSPVTLYPPANDPFVITVGAVADMGTPDLSDDVIPDFSAYGTSEDNFAKPDLVAPGRNIISLLASSTAKLAIDHPSHVVDDQSFRMSGTSTAAPVVSGAVALLLQGEPGLTPDQVKYRLLATANKNWLNYEAAKAGAGTLDIYAAINGNTTANANTGIAASQMLWTGNDVIAWDSVSWNSVSWNSVSWNSVSWNSEVWTSSIWDDEPVNISRFMGHEAVNAPDSIIDATTPADRPTEQADESQMNRLFLPLVNQ